VGVPKKYFMKHFKHKTGVCVIGGGMAGICAAIAAAREGVKVVLMQDRPVLGGNASGEVRVHVSGADRNNRIPNVRETGIIEEIRLENLYRNPERCFSIWDTVLYEKVKLEPNITLLLNCSCNSADVKKNSIKSVTGWQLTTETYHKVTAKVFIDCSGDSLLAVLTGAKFRIGREARKEFNESLAQEKSDRHTMGISLTFIARDTGKPQKFIPPSWAYKYPDEESLPFRSHKHLTMGYWWIEYGGMIDNIHDTELIRDELLKILYGVWDHLKNCGDHGAENLTLDWVQFLPGRRESRRYIGDHVLNQNDVDTLRVFPDEIAYGGWTMDIHPSEGFYFKGKPTVFNKTPSPYGIPYRSLYSKNINNLMFAGRNISATHVAMSSTRVMATGSLLGQATGTAAGIAVNSGTTPRGVYKNYMPKLQQKLLNSDCYLPNYKEQFSKLTLTSIISASEGNPEPLRDGINRPVGETQHCWAAHTGSWVQYEFTKPVMVRKTKIVFDSALIKKIALSHHAGATDHETQMVSEMTKGFRVEVLSNGTWVNVYETQDNHQRLNVVKIHKKCSAVKLTILSTWGTETPKVFTFAVE